MPKERKAEEKPPSFKFSLFYVETLIEEMVKEISLSDALESWLAKPQDAMLKHLLSGAATKPQVKALMDQRNKSKSLPKKTQPDEVQQSAPDNEAQ